jgi:hypothetical protein
LTVSGPGFLNGLVALANATTNCFPVVQISGSSDRHIVDLIRGDHEELDQMAAAERSPRPPIGWTAPKTSAAASPRFMGHTIQVGEETLLADIEQRLVDEFPCVAPAAVNTLIRKEHARLETSRIRDFVPLLVDKSGRRELKHKPPGGDPLPLAASGPGNSV